MQDSILLKFGLRWLISSLGLWVAAGILGPDRLSVEGKWTTVAIAGLFLALVNLAVKPFVIFLSLPAIVLSLGLFMLVVNGLIIMIASWLYHPLFVKNLGVAVVAGVLVGMVNLLVSRVVKEI